MLHKPPCNFECVPKTDKEKEEEIHVDEFVGPVRIRLMNISKLYLAYKQWFSTLLSLANGMLLTNYIFVFLYAGSFKLAICNNLHVFFCTIGYQLILFTGIYIMNTNFGPSMPLFQKDRLHQHITSQIAGFLFSCVGTIPLGLIHSPLEFLYTWHSRFGILTVLSTLGAVVFGAITWRFKKSIWLRWTFKVVHVLIAAGFIVCSSACFVTGLQQTSFVSWATMTFVSVQIMMMCFCAFYTAVAFISCFLNVYSEITHK